MIIINIHDTIASKNLILPCKQAIGNSVLSIHMLKTKKRKRKKRSQKSLKEYVIILRQIWLNPNVFGLLQIHNRR